MSASSRHPDPALLLQYQKGHLRGAAAREIIEHARECQACREDLEALGVFDQPPPEAGDATTVLAAALWKQFASQARSLRRRSPSGP